MPWWIELPLYLLGSLAISFSITSVMLLPGVMYFFERYFVGPLTALLILTALGAILSDPNLQTIAGLASFFHNDAGY